MFIDANRVQPQAKTDRCLFRGAYTVYWRGFIYLDGLTAGVPSIERFVDELVRGESLPSLATRLKGIYFIAVRDQQSGATYVFVDGSGLFHAFYSNRFAGTSFLDLVDAERLSPADFDPESLVEFLHMGNVYSGKTLFSSIKKIDPAHIISFSRDGSLSLLPKPVRDIGVPVELSFEDSMRRFVQSAANENISVDLTGGIDSRMLAVILQFLGLRFEVATCGIAGEEDVEIARRVADVLGLDLRVTTRTMDNVNWAEAFNDCDGLFDVVRACSQVQMRRERVKRGINLVVSGVGGELLKDFWWLQDMPFYSRREADIHKLYKFRLAPAPLQHSYLSETYRALSGGYRERTLEQLSQYVVGGNTCTYDRIYYFYKMREYAGRSISNNLHEIGCYAPYLERDVVAFGYQLPRTTRFFNNFHRRTVTSLNPKAARIPTTEGGITVSAETSALCRDLVRYATDKCMRLTNKVGQRLLNRSCVAGNFAATDITSTVRNAATQRRTIERLKDSGILDPHLQADQIGTDYLGRMLSLDLLMERLESSQRIAARELAEVA